MVVVLAMLVLVEVRLLAVHLIGVAETCCWSVHGGRRYHHISFRLSYSISLPVSFLVTLSVCLAAPPSEARILCIICILL